MIGGGYLAAAWVLDRRRLVGLGTPFVAIGFVGARGHARRASVWLGALTAVIGITVVIEDIVDLDDSASAFAIFAILVGAGIVVGAAFLSRFLGEPDDEQPDRQLPEQAAPAS